VLFTSAVVLLRAGWIGPALGFLAVVFVGHLIVLGSADIVEAALAGIGLLFAGELGQWSIDARWSGRHDDAMHRLRGSAIAGLGLRGVGVVLLCGLAAGLPLTGGIELVLVATAAVVALFWLTALALARVR